MIAECCEPLICLLFCADFTTLSTQLLNCALLPDEAEQASTWAWIRFRASSTAKFERAPCEADRQGHDPKQRCDHDEIEHHGPAQCQEDEPRHQKKHELHGVSRDSKGPLMAHTRTWHQHTAADVSSATAHATNDGDRMTNAVCGQFQVLATRPAALPDTERL
jgi:hypothetical protein